MSALTYNVIITKSLSLMKELFFPKNRKRTSVGRFINERNNRDLLHLSPGQQGGLIEFDFNLPSEGKGGKYATLKLVDTKEISDFFVLDKHPVKTLLADRLLSINNFKSGAIDHGEVLKLRDAYYITFGCGDDISNWTNPYYMTLAQGSVTNNSNGVRVVELLFQPSFHTINTHSDLYYNDETYGGLESQFDTKLNSNSEISIKATVTFDTQGSLPKAGYKPNLGSAPRFNYWIRALLRRYLHQLYPTTPIGNILVLFSANLDKRGKKSTLYPENFDRVNNVVNAFNTTLSRLGIDIYAVTGQNKSPPIVVNNLSRIAKNRGPEDANNALITSSRGVTVTSQDDAGAQTLREKQIAIRIREDIKRDLEALNKSTEPRRSGWTTARLNYSQSLREYSLESLRGRIDLLGVPTLDQNINVFDLIQKLRSVYNNDDAVALIAMSNSGITPMNMDEPAENPQEINTNSVNISMEHLATQDTPKEERNILTPLYDFFRGLKKYGPNKSINFTLFEENDLRITKYLAESGIIEDGEHPVIIFGEKDIIEKFIYPKTPFTSEPQNAQADDGDGSTLTFLGENPYIRWVDYSRKFSENFYSNFQADRASCFNEIAGIYKSFKDKISENDILFTYNVKNSNVLDVSYTNDAYLNRLLQIASQSEIQVKASERQASIITEDNRTKIEDIINYVKGKVPTKDKTRKDIAVGILELLQKDTEFIRLVYKSNNTGLPEAKTRDFVEIISFLASDLELPGPKAISVPGDRHKTYADTIDYLCRLTTQATIKTLPFFNISNIYGRSCFLYGLQNQIKGSVLNTKGYNTVYTGRYTILGVRHFISANSAFSEFDLTRLDLIGENSKLDDYDETVEGTVKRTYPSRRDPTNTILGGRSRGF